MLIRTINVSEMTSARKWVKNNSLGAKSDA